MIDNKDGTVSWHGTVDGIKTEIVYGHQPEIDPGPSGEELLAPRRPKNQAEAFLQSMVREDVTDPAKSVGNAMDPLGALFNREAPPTPASSSTTTPAHGQAVEGAGWIAEIRAAGQGTEPPPDFLAVEAIVRALYGEPHLLEALGTEQRSQASYTALRHQLARHRWIGANPAPTIDRAKYLTMTWMGVTPSIE